ncbi:uncharacterized protein [Pocillopora verrucosa]|uniref:uncharacterized protein isoform X2 n=1 Tax=Pocillopora verrucosa TaxID=203993 RepID=UPI00279761C0|nr:uncharacterized protein LOC131776627 isoform X2 [Pocillopora verrucosa]
MFALAGKPLFNAYATDDNIVHLCRTLTVEEVGTLHERKLYQCVTVIIRRPNINWISRDSYFNLNKVLVLQLFQGCSSVSKMISAVADSCSVRLDKANGKVYKFHALVFNQDAQGNNKGAYLDRKKENPSGPATRSILSQQPKTEWKCAYNELLSGRKDMQRQNDDPLSGPIRKKSKPSEDSTDEPDHETKTERQRVRFKGVDDSETETSTCPACKQIIVKETEEYDSLMEKSKEDLVAMVMNLSLNLQNRRRKLGYCPSEKDIAELKQLNISKTEQTAPKTRPTRTRRRSSSRKRLTSV